MARDGWGAPRIHAELTKLGFSVSEVIVSRYMPRRLPEPDRVQRWVAFLRNHKNDIAAMDLFTVPTASLRLLYGFFVIDHGRRQILHFNATFHPTAAWVMQQLREAFPDDAAPRYLILDRDSIFSAAVAECITSMGTSPVRTSFRSQSVSNCLSRRHWELEQPSAVRNPTHLVGFGTSCWTSAGEA